MDSSKSPFDSSPFSGPGESQASESTSATGMFGKVTPQATQPSEQDDLLQSLLRNETVPAKTNFPDAPTQPVEQPPLEATQPAPTGGSFTQMFEALKPADTQSAKIENT